MKTYTETVYELTCILSEVQSTVISIEKILIEMRQNAAYNRYVDNKDKSERTYRVGQMNKRANKQEILKKYGMK